MSTGAPSAPGTKRKCPHCRATILESASICPVCQHHLRFTPGRGRPREPSFSPLRVEGTIRHPSVGEAWEYSVMVTIRNERGEEVTRQVVGVGALNPEERRTFSLTVDVFTPDKARPSGS